MNDVAIVPPHTSARDVMARHWSDIAILVALLGDPGFDRALYDFVADRTDAAVLFAIELGNEAAGRVLMTEAADTKLTEHARHISRLYANEDYAQDDVLTEQIQLPPGALSLVIQHPEDRDAAFRARYFDDVGTAEELSVFDRGSDNVLYLGFCCTTRRFGPEQLADVRDLAPLLGSLVRRHAALLSPKQPAVAAVREGRLAALRRALLEHEAGLTAREADVCAAIVIGYRAETVAERLGIAMNTVATHRKRAYAKLKISSQTELFGIFFGFGV